MKWTSTWEDANSIANLDIAVREYEELKRRLDSHVDIISDDDENKSDDLFYSGYTSDEDGSMNEDKSNSDYEFLQEI